MDDRVHQVLLDLQDPQGRPVLQDCLCEPNRWDHCILAVHFLEIDVSAPKLYRVFANKPL